MSTSPDILIVGAGIVGAACAMECAMAGLKVLVLDRGPVGGGTTAAGMGHIVLMDDSEAQFALTHYSRRLWHDLRPHLPEGVEMEVCGTLWVAADDEEMAEVHRKAKYLGDRNVRFQVLDRADLEKAEPNLRRGMAGGLVVVEDSVIYPPCAAFFFLEQARRHGAEVRTGLAVKNLRSDGTALLADGSGISAGRCVNAAGPWSPALTPGLPVRKRKGHLVVTDRHPGFVRHQLVELGYLKSAHSTGKDSVAFNIQPRRNGQMLIGSFRQFDAEDSTVEQEMLDRMLRRALEYLPALGRLAAIRTWAGHRPATPDKLPIIGPSILSDRVWLAAGHEGLGITTATGTGRLLADLLLGRPTEIPAAPYAPSRMANGNGNTQKH